MLTVSNLFEQARDESVLVHLPLTLNNNYDTYAGTPTFTRGATKNYTDIYGVAQTAAIDEPVILDGLYMDNLGAAERLTLQGLGNVPPYEHALEIEFNLVSTGGFQRIYTNGSDFELYISGSNLVLKVGDVTESTAISFGVVNKFAYSATSSGVVAYLNGNKWTIPDAYTTAPTVADIIIGNNSGGTNPISGYIKGFKIHYESLEEADLQRRTK